MLRKRILAILMAITMMLVYVPPVQAEEVPPAQTEVSVPPTVTLHEATEITHDSAKLSFDVSAPEGEYEISSISLFYYLTESGSSGAAAKSGSVGSNEFTINALNPGKEYSFYCEAVYATTVEPITSETVTSEIRTFSTSQAPLTPSTVQTKSASYNSSTKKITAKGSWTAGDYTVTEKGFVYSYTNGSPSISDSKKTSTSANADYTEEFVVDDTKSVCYVRSYLHSSEEGTIYGSTTVSVTLPATTNTPAVTNEAVSSVSVNSARAYLSVTSVGAGIKERGVILSTNNGRLSHDKVPSEASAHKASGTTIGSAYVDITGLTSNTTYYYKAYVLGNDNQYTYASNYVAFTTSSSSNIPTVSTGTIDNITNNTASVSITISKAGGSSVKERGVVYSSTNATPTVNDSRKTISNSGTGTFTVDLSGLGKTTTYYVRAYAVNNDGTAYGAVKSFKTTASSSMPDATTSSIGDVTAYNAEVTINISSSYDVTERGVVYSSSDTTPEVGRSKCYEEKIFGTTGSVTVLLTGLSRNTTYYVRAYARNTNGYGYGEVRTLKTDSSNSIPVVETVSASATSADSIDVRLDVSSDGGSSITERGIVYSRTNKNPKLKGSASTIERAEDDTDLEAVELTSLSANSVYYVRAYASNRYGTGYGVVMEVKLGSTNITTNKISDVSAASAIAGGYVSRSINSSVKERGIVFSTTKKLPTVSDEHISSNVDTYGNFSVKMSNLTSNRTYYVRAYIRTSSGYEYGNTVEFSTGTGTSRITIVFATSEGSQISTQTLNLAPNNVITAMQLSVPAGYYLIRPDIAYTVQAYDDKLNVIVRLEGVYMESSGNLFEPNRYATRIEVVRMIYALRGMNVMGSARTFTDIPADYQFKKELDFASSMGYVKGDTDGRFRPNDSFTRAEMATICNTIFGYKTTSTTNPFSDVGSHWGRQAILSAYHNSIILGYPDGSFKPDGKITRAELCALFAKAEKRQMKPIGTVDFADVPPSHWAYQAIMNAAIAKP